ncbi:vacuolar fusion protein MON1 homolog A-like [Schistocerca gregaria]|uniref:vacuolar fusion protein MON1 homolog A-like n=1 Tax=Schistocerca gregaria TaxID=7010 RepID=UPI00211DB251|nr:vacuolar fusion protein MON1 homolog A-like [Schistocerca gregaria]
MALSLSESTGNMEQENSCLSEVDSLHTGGDTKSEEKRIDSHAAVQKNSLYLDSMQSNTQKDRTTKNDLKRHRKCIFIMSWSGRPIYSYYHGEAQVASLMSIFTSLISIVSLKNDDIQYFKAGETILAFKMVGPVWLVYVSTTGRPVELIFRQLDTLYLQLLFILTDRVSTHLNTRPQLDVRQFLEGNDKYMDGLVRWTSKDLAYALGCIHPYVLDQTVREELFKLLQKECSEDMLYVLIVARGRLVQFMNQRQVTPLKPIDIHLLIQFIQYTEAFSYGESSLCPVCLPTHDSHNYLNLYIASTGFKINLVILSSVIGKQDSLFKRECRLFKKLKSSDLLNHFSDDSNQYYDVKEVCVPGLYHFLFKLSALVQMTMPRFSTPYHVDSEKKRLKRLYQYCIAKAGDKKNSRGMFSILTEYELAVCQVTAEYELYAIFGVTESRKGCTQRLNSIVKWVMRESKKLFIKH